MWRFCLRKLPLCVSAACLLTYLMGCGRTGHPELVPVSGVVQFQGKPLEGAEVVFRNEQAPRFAVGITDKHGRFRLTSFQTNDGAVVGEHKVTISKSKANPELSGASVENPSAAYGQGMAAAASGKLDKIAKQELPAKYADPKTSSLTATVSKDSKKEFDFKLD